MIEPLYRALAFTSLALEFRDRIPITHLHRQMAIELAEQAVRLCEFMAQPAPMTCESEQWDDWPITETDRGMERDNGSGESIQAGG
jgi:hypothetical protein